jgi:GDP-L-fucose synthase
MSLFTQQRGMQLKFLERFIKVLFNNLGCFFNLARCSHDYGKMIYYGSGAEYDKRYYLPKMTEDYFDAHVPVDDYGFLNI